MPHWIDGTISGVIGPVLDDLLDCGVSGFQGFQWEYGALSEFTRETGMTPLTRSGMDTLEIGP